MLGGATPGRPSATGFGQVSGSVALYAAVIGLDAYWAVQRFQFAHGAAVLSYATAVVGCVSLLDWKACGRQLAAVLVSALESKARKRAERVGPFGSRDTA